MRDGDSGSDAAPGRSATAPIGVVGVLIAAGRSRRMGSQKLLLPWPPSDGPSTVIASAFDLIRPHCERMIVVLGDDEAIVGALNEGASEMSREQMRAGIPRGEHAAESTKLSPRATRGGGVGSPVRRTFERVRGAPERDMLDSIRVGLEAARGAEIVLLQPADHPAASSTTVLRVIESMKSAAAHSTPIIAVMPEHAGRGGHPVAIRCSAIDAILVWRGPDGLAGYWRHIAASVTRLPVDDPACVRDLDRPEDYT